MTATRSANRGGEIVKQESSRARHPGSAGHRPRACVTALALLVCIGVTACGGNSANKADAGGNGTSGASFKGGEDIAGKKVLFIHANDSGNVFDKPVIAGSKAAAELTGLKVETQFSNNNSNKLRSIFQSGVAEKVAGIVVSVPDASLNGPICAARKAGIPVITWNVNGTTGEGRDCVMAFLGQDFVTTGAVIGQRMIDDGLIKAGDKVFCPVEYPNSDYAAQRAAGVDKALGTIGAKCDVVGIGADLAKARTTMTQYLLGHRDTSAIVSLGGTGTSVATDAVKQSGLKKVEVGGFDLTPQVIKGIKSGGINATVDQQPYSQGYLAVMEMGLYLKFGLFPSDVATGGTGLVDKSNVDVVSRLVPDFR
jgi:simple sugar transport system substrate-binding protein